MVPSKAFVLVGIEMILADFEILAVVALVLITDKSIIPHHDFSLGFIASFLLTTLVVEACVSWEISLRWGSGASKICFAVSISNISACSRFTSHTSCKTVHITFSLWCECWFWRTRIIIVSLIARFSVCIGAVAKIKVGFTQIICAD